MDIKIFHTNFTFNERLTSLQKFYLTLPKEHTFSFNKLWDAHCFVIAQKCWPTLNFCKPIPSIFLEQFFFYILSIIFHHWINMFVKRMSKWKLWLPTPRIRETEASLEALHQICFSSWHSLASSLMKFICVLL